MKVTKVDHVVFNENPATHEVEKDAIYVGNILVAEGNPLSAAQLSYHLASHSPFYFKKYFMQNGDMSFPQFFQEIEPENLKTENLFFEVGQQLTFTCLSDGIIVFGKGRIDAVLKDEYLIKENKTGEIYSVRPLEKEHTLYRLFFSTMNPNIPLTETLNLNRVIERQQQLIAPEKEQVVSFHTKDRSGKGCVKSIRFSKNSGGEAAYFAVIQTETGDIEVACNHKIYPEDSITWENSPVILI